jgi:hypothetical protein
VGVGSLSKQYGEEERKFSKEREGFVFRKRWKGFQFVIINMSPYRHCLRKKKK